MPAKTCLLFSMNHCDNEAGISYVASLFVGNDYRVVRCDYWNKDYTPLHRLTPEMEYLTLSDGGFDAIPRLSHDDYVRLCGDDIDFVACNLHTYLAQQFPLTREYLFEESLFFQRLRGFAYRIETLLRVVRPDCTVTPHGGEVISRLIMAKALKWNIPCMVWESGFFPNTAVLDAAGMHFFPKDNEIDACWSQLSALCDTNARAVDTFIQNWKAVRQSKYVQPIASIESQRLESFLRKQTTQAGRKLLFFPLQVANDANVLLGLRAFESLSHFLHSTICVLPSEWCMVVKQHPKAQEPLFIPEHERVLNVTDVDLLGLIERCDAVATFSSNVGLEALMYDKPVIVGGRPYYADKGLTIDIVDHKDLPVAFSRVLQHRPPAAVRDMLLHFLLSQYLVPNQPDILSRKVSIASEMLTRREMVRAPLCSGHYEMALPVVALVKQYSELASRNLGHEQIMARLQIPEQIARLSAPRQEPQGERQVATHFGDVDQRHLTRYSFAAKVIGAASTVLDIACGNGYGSYLLAQETGARVVGVDGSREAIKQAEAYWRHPYVRYERASVGEFLAETNGLYDAIVSFETIEHVYSDHEFLRGLWAKLASGGVLLLSMPNADGIPLGGNPFHIRHYTADGLHKLFAELPGAQALLVSGLFGTHVLKAESGASTCLVCMATKGTDIRGRREIVRSLLPYVCTMVPTQRSIVIGHERFLTATAHQTAESILIDYSETECHAIYGPYTRIPQGRWRVVFDLRATGSQDELANGGVTVEVVAATGQCLASRELRLPDLRTSAARELTFEVKDGLALHEFRTYVRGKPTGVTLTFGGIALELLE